MRTGKQGTNPAYQENGCGGGLLTPTVCEMLFVYVKQIVVSGSTGVGVCKIFS